MLENFYESLRIMLYGMSGIFIVIAVIFLSVVVMNRIFKPKPEEDEK